MPAHPIPACYCHVIEAGHANLRRQHAEGDILAVGHELTHLQEATTILNDYLLYAPNDERWSDDTHERYWDVIRPAYMQMADDRSIYTFFAAWEFLAIATRFGYRDQLAKDEQRLRRLLGI